MIGTKRGNPDDQRVRLALVVGVLQVPPRHQRVEPGAVELLADRVRDAEGTIDDGLPSQQTALARIARAVGGCPRVFKLDSHVGNVVQPPMRVAFDAATDHAAHAFRRIARQVVKVDAIVQHRRDAIADGRAREGARPGEHLEEHHTE